MKKILFFLLVAGFLISLFTGAYAQEITIPDGRVLREVADQLDTYEVSLGKKAGIQVGDVVKIMRGNEVLARAVFTSVSDTKGTVVILGSTSLAIRERDLVRFEKPGKNRLSSHR